MHSMMDGEGGSEPQDVFVELGTLIMEGRVPGGGNARGYGEGPHCASQGIGGSAARHSCNPQQNFLCKRIENFRKHVLLLFQNNIPMCIEVFLCADCLCGAQKSQSAEVGIVSPSTDLLLEQWTITVMNRNGLGVPAGEPASTPMLARGLVQAVRSQLHFSQLSAWWSKSKGNHPSHVSYRVTVPGQVFASQFQREPNKHTFPVAAVGKGHAIQVCVRSLPRMELIPVVPCPVHSACVTLGVSAPACEGADSPRPSHCPEGNSCPSVGGSVTSGTVARDSTGDSSLGESLLDPPQRFRSPPRTAEGPDHILFRCIPGEVVGARWQGDNAPSTPSVLPGRWQRREGMCIGSVVVNSSACARAVNWRQSTEVNRCHTPEGILDDRMQTECNQPGKHHCSCEGEEEIENVQAPTQVRQRRRSQVSMVTVSTQSLPTSSTATELTATTTASSSPPDDSASRFVNEPKRSSGLALSNNDYVMHASEGVGSGVNNTVSLKRRWPVVDATEMNVVTAPDADCVGVSASCALAGALEPGPVQPQCLSTPAPHKLKPPLSKWELDEVLAVLRNKNKPHHHRPSLQTHQVWYRTRTDSRTDSRTSPPSKLEDIMGHGSKTSDTCVPLFRLSSPTENTKKSSKCDLVDAILRSASYHRFTGRNVQRHRLKQGCDNVARTKQCDFAESNCDIKKGGMSQMWSSGQIVANVRTRGKKLSFDLIEDHNNQVICDNYTSLQNSDIVDKYHCLSEVSQTSQTKEETKCQPYSDKGSKYTTSVTVGSTPLTPRSLLSLARKGDCSMMPLLVRCVSREEPKEEQKSHLVRHFVPSASERARFRRSFDSAASMVFHTRTGLPLTSSPAPVRRGTSRFDYDSSLNSVSAIRSALFDSALNGVQTDDGLSISSDDAESESGARSPCSPDLEAGIVFPALRTFGPCHVVCHALAPCSSLLGSFEESVLNGRLEPVSTVQGFTAELGASGSFCPRHLRLPVAVFFYTLGDYDKVSTPYLGHINLGKKGYNVPRSGTIQVTLFNPMGTVIKMFVVMYDLTDMPASSHTFLRQRTLYMPVGSDEAEDLPDNSQKWLRYLIHLRFLSSKSGRIYLHTDIRMIIFRKADMDTATAHHINNNIDSGFELRSFTHGPGNPKFSPR